MEHLDATRRSLHGVAELLLAGPQFRRAGTIKLMVAPGGFRAWTDEHLGVDGTDLVVAGRRRPISGRTCAELAADAGIDLGGPGNYDDGSDVTPNEPLTVDAAAARRLADCWAAGDAALRRLAPDESPILWPEHFDVAILHAGGGFGVSPGDRYVDEPYAYVTPPAPGRGDFWNAPFGAARPMRELGDADGVLAFFTDGRARFGA